MMPENGPISVPPGFRFHPTDEELLYYYLKKKVSYEAIDLDVIREVDLNKLEPWDLKERCRIGLGPQNDWYFFSHKDRKYPTGTRTNRATTAGFWKATGRDKAIYHVNAKRIGMRKTLVFYTGRAPHGQKTDWIMHEYRLEDDHSQIQQEDGWVVCRVFKKKNHGGRGTLLQAHELQQDDDYENNNNNNNNDSNPNYLSSSSHIAKSSFHQHNYTQPLIFPPNYNTFDPTLHLPQLSSPDTLAPAGATLLGTMDNLLRLTSNVGGGGGGVGVLTAQHRLMPAGGQDHRVISNSNNNGAEWFFLEKLLVNYNQETTQEKGVVDELGMSLSSNGINQDKFPFQYLGNDQSNNFFKFSK